MNTHAQKSNFVNVNVRVDKNIKDLSEKILAEMGFSMSTAINSFLRQVVAERSLPYRPSTTETIPSLLDEDLMTTEELNDLLLNALAEANSGNCHPAEEVFEELGQKYGISF